MMSEDVGRWCPECEGELQPISLIDKVEGPKTHRRAGELEYRLPADKMSFWTGKYPTAGRVEAYMCGECGRILLYAGRGE